MCHDLVNRDWFVATIDSDKNLPSHLDTACQVAKVIIIYSRQSYFHCYHGQQCSCNNFDSSDKRIIIVVLHISQAL